jgi:hypothetical protein
MKMTNNKYKKWYFSLMEKAQTRSLEREVPAENHHVIPRSLRENQESQTTVRLTIREHLLAHHMLPKFLSGLEKAKMDHAYFRMVNGRQGKFVHLSDSAYNAMMKSYSEARVLMRTGTKHTEETKRKISKSNMGKVNSSETRNKISKANTGKLIGVKRPQEFGENLSRLLTGIKKTKEHSDKINKNPEKIRKTAEKHRGMKRSPEAKEKMRISALARIERQGGPWNKGLKQKDYKSSQKKDSSLSVVLAEQKTDQP